VSGNHLKVFTIALTPVASGKITLTVKGTSVAYKNDGKGTKIPVPETPLYIIAEPPASEEEVAKNPSLEPENHLAEMILTDSKLPESFKIDLGHDPALYDGKYFISFYSTDADSGVNRYEVQEDGGTIIRSGNVYVLRNQNLNGVVKVYAIDNAGNTRTETLELHGVPTSGVGFSWSMALIVILVVLIIKIMYLIFKPKKRKNRS
jgi:hypothetical protein